VTETLSLQREGIPQPRSHPVKVRVGTPDDVHPMMDIALMATEENGFFQPNTHKLLNNIWAALNLDHGIVGIIGAPGEQIEGAVLLRSGPLWYSDDEVLEEKAVFTHPAYRGAAGGRASRLVEFSKLTADTLKMPLFIGVLSGERMAAKVKLYTRHLGHPMGGYWVYRPNTEDVK
jgi:hypothetical protein